MIVLLKVPIRGFVVGADTHPLAGVFLTEDEVLARAMAAHVGSLVAGKNRLERARGETEQFLRRNDYLIDTINFARCEKDGLMLLKGKPSIGLEETARLLSSFIPRNFTPSLPSPLLFFSPLPFLFLSLFSISTFFSPCVSIILKLTNDVQAWPIARWRSWAPSMALSLW